MIPQDRNPLRLPRAGVALITLITLGTLPAWSQKSPPPATVGSADAGLIQLIADDAEVAPSARMEVRPELAARAQSGLPPEAAELLNRFSQQEAKARQEVEASLAQQRQMLIQQLKELQDRYTRAGKLDEAIALRDHVRRLEGGAGAASPGGPSAFPHPGEFTLPGSGGGAHGKMAPGMDGGGPGLAPPGFIPGGPGMGSRRYTPAIPSILDPGTFIDFRNRVGQRFLVEVTGRDDGNVWGTDIYSDDSTLATAVVHAGLLKTGEHGVVRVTILPPQPGFNGSTKNGVTTQSFGPWEGSYRVEPALMAPITFRPPVGPAPENLLEYRDKVGQTFRFLVVGSTAGPLWGDAIYTDDSSIAAAAVHAGILREGQHGIVQVTILPPQDSYKGSTRNGVTSQPYAEWGGSFKVEPVRAPALDRLRELQVGPPRLSAPDAK